MICWSSKLALQSLRWLFRRKAFSENRFFSFLVPTLIGTLLGYSCIPNQSQKSYIQLCIGSWINSCYVLSYNYTEKKKWWGATSLCNLGCKNSIIELFRWCLSPDDHSVHATYGTYIKKLKIRCAIWSFVFNVWESESSLVCTTRYSFS